MNLNKFLGFYLEDVIEILKDDGYKIDNVFLTKNPSESKSIDENSRVIRIDCNNEKNLRIIVC